jgi:FkbM family methyltransferase
MLWKRYHRYVNGYWTGQYEFAAKDALVRLLEPGDYFYDVGANAGFFSLVAAHRVGPFGQVVAFEPFPSNADVLREQFALNQLANCRVVEAALADQPGKMTLCFRKNNFTTPHLGNARIGESTTEVEVTTLDDCIAELGEPRVIKMDVEGAEYSALEGATRLVAKRSTRWLIELHGPEVGEKVRNLFRHAGYRLSGLGGQLIKNSQLPSEYLIAEPT